MSLCPVQCCLCSGWECSLYTRPLIVNEMLVSGRPPTHTVCSFPIRNKALPAAAASPVGPQRTPLTSCWCALLTPLASLPLGMVTLPVHHCRWKLSPAESQCFKPARMAQLFIFPKPLAGCLSLESLYKYAGWSKEGMLVLGEQLPYSAPSWLMIK